VNAVRPRVLALTHDRRREIAPAVEHHHRVLAPIEHIDVVVAVDADTADLLEGPACWQFRPVGIDRYLNFPVPTIIETFLSWLLRFAAQYRECKSPPPS